VDYWPPPLKTAKIIMTLKAGKAPTDVTSYRPVSLLPTTAKVLEKLILNRITQDSNPQIWIPNHQFGFRRAHSTIQQSHRIANTISNASTNKQYCKAAFLDIAQAFDNVWHSGLLYKIKYSLPSNYYNLLKSYISERSFVVKINEEISNRLPVSSGVPQGSLLSPLLYTHYTHDLPTTNKTIIGTFTDDITIFATHDNPNAAPPNLQEHLVLIEAWLNKWKIEVNESKSTQTTFPLRKGT
jgi:retron-type reverse transcriptase